MPHIPAKFGPWIPCADELPDDEMTVLIALSDGEVWTGFHDEGEWRYVSGDRVDQGEGITVEHWAEFPSVLNPDHDAHEKATCGICKSEMELVRPGKHQCNHCEATEFLESRWHKSAEIAGQLIAIIRVNTMRGTWETSSIQDVEDFLVPWIAKLDEVKPLPEILNNGGC